MSLSTRYLIVAVLACTVALVSKAGVWRKTATVAGVVGSSLLCQDLLLSKPSEHELLLAGAKPIPHMICDQHHSSGQGGPFRSLFEQRQPAQSAPQTQAPVLDYKVAPLSKSQITAPTLSNCGFSQRASKESADNSDAAITNFKALLNPGLADGSFLAALQRLIPEWRGNPRTLSVLKRYLNPENCAYLARRLTQLQLHPDLDTTAACDFFVRDCDSKLMAGYLLGLMKAHGNTAPDVAKFYDKTIAPVADANVDERLPHPILAVIVTIMQEAPDYNGAHWAKDLSAYSALPHHLTMIPWADRIRETLTAQFPDILRGNAALLSDLLQLGIDFDLDLLRRTDPQLTMTVDELRRMAPFLDQTNLGRNGLYMLQRGRYDLFQELFRHENLVRNVIWQGSDLQYVPLFCLMSLEMGHAELVETMVGVPDIRKFVEAAVTDQNKVLTTIQSLVAAFQSETDSEPKSEIPLDAISLTNHFFELVRILEQNREAESKLKGPDNYKNFSSENF